MINTFPKGIYTKKDAKDKLTKLYAKYGISRKAKTTDLANDFKMIVRETQRRIEIL